MTEMNKKTDQLTDEQRTCLAKASRHDVNGWIYVKVQGMSNRFTKDILIQVADVAKAAQFYVVHLGFEITDETRDSHTHTHMISLHGDQINLL